MVTQGIRLSFPARVGLYGGAALFLALNTGRACRVGYVQAHLRQAAQDGSGEQVVYWLNRGANINAPDSFGDTPLMIAARNARPDIVRVLLARGADPFARDAFGLDAAHWARYHCRDSRAVQQPDGIEIRQVPRPESMQTIALIDQVIELTVKSSHLP